MGIRLEGVTTRPGRGARPLESITFAIEPGLVAVVGPEASGKSALMSLIAAQSRPSRGRLIVGGEDTVRAAAHVRSRVCLLAEGAGLYPGLTLYENLHSTALLQPRVDLGDCERQIHDALSEMELQERASLRMAELSPGEQFRAVIAAARLQPRPYLLVEEPAAGLTDAERDLARACLKRLPPGTLVLIASRTAAGFERHADQVAVLAQGSLRYFGPVNELLQSIRGKVWTFRIDAGDEPPLITGFTRTRILREPEGTVVWGVSDRAPVAEAVRAAESLEDAYRWLLAGYEVAAGRPN